MTDVLIVRACGHRRFIIATGPMDSAQRAAEKEKPCPDCPVDAHLPIGTVLVIGHPANNVTWFRTARGWIDTAGNDPQQRNPAGFFDTIGHEAYAVRRLGTGR